MAWPKGMARPAGSGRKKGVKNKDTRALEDILAAFDGGKGFDPIEEMTNLYALIHADNPLVAVKILTHLSDKIYPDRKAIDHTGEIHISFSEGIKKARERVISARSH